MTKADKINYWGKNMKQILLERKINYLMHFTRVENLPSIFQYGLLPRNELSEDECIFNDQYRYDGCLNAICTSIEFPNYKMFYRLRMENPETNWAVLAIDVNVLMSCPCAFCETNAGSQAMYSIPLDDRYGDEALRKLFCDISEGNKREELRIPSHYPTNPQAEVLVFGRIPVEYIKYVFFENVPLQLKYRSIIPSGIQSRADNRYFYPRSDYKYWQEQQSELIF